MKMDFIKKRYIIRIFEFKFDCLGEDQIIFKFEVFDSNLILAFFRSLLERGLFGGINYLRIKSCGLCLHNGKVPDIFPCDRPGPEDQTFTISREFILSRVYYTRVDILNL